jgi:hypothetical protein
MLSTGKGIIHKDIPHIRLESGNSMRLKPRARVCVVVVDSIACRGCENEMGNTTNAPTNRRQQSMRERFRIK